MLNKGASPSDRFGRRYNSPSFSEGNVDNAGVAKGKKEERRLRSHLGFDQEKMAGLPLGVLFKAIC